ncbi:MAG: Dyp-type peroxidase [Gammaproteobacteria bacterium]|nr:Dyp-type peroxidase [Gammaproteobacteria bacterium]MBU0786641.1 Dyp-type peroxidase [Gammaproteobacteria bacterium]MBU0814288.1 Dyp-type peroxidase [Gammaproteobacteria bacterium]MBU1786192.1 Dyp-type peroxidase [Gammaproteobacteria bacterium]
MTQTAQPGILAPIPPQARFLNFQLRPDSNPGPVLKALANEVDGVQVVVGIGALLASALGAKVPGLRSFEGMPGAKVKLPVTPAALWLWLRGDERGELLHLSRHLENLLAPAFTLESITDAFRYVDFRDLSGYEDGTENPQGDEALAAALVPATDATLAASSFVAVQRWQHNFAHFDGMSRQQQNDIFGRDRDSNEELDEAPITAHVKRTAQESFEPEAFVLRRSMPWAEGKLAGLVFTAFGHSLDAFEALLRRMSGAEDGLVDGLFQFTHPDSGAYFWCPALHQGKLDLRPLGL